MQQFKEKLTIKELKHILEYWPEEDCNGQPIEVWIEVGSNVSSSVTSTLLGKIHDLTAKEHHNDDRSFKDWEADQQYEWFVEGKNKNL